MRKARWLSVVVMGTALGVLWLLAAPPVDASHYDYRATRDNDSGNASGRAIGGR